MVKIRKIDKAYSYINKRQTAWNWAWKEPVNKLNKVFNLIFYK